MQRNPDAVFFEKQPVRDNKIFYLAAVIGVGLIVYFGYAIFQQIVLGRPFGDKPMGDAALAIVGGLYVLLGAAFLYLFFRCELTTEVRPAGLFLKYSPFHRTFQQIPLDGLRSCRARKYRPLWEYGGWGIRVGVAKKAYNVSGSHGVELVYEAGNTLLVGSKKADQLATAIDSIRPK
jgi:hypothetical protein